MPDPHFLTIARASELIRRRELSPVELTRALLRRIESLDSQVNAFITITAEQALTQARKAEREIIGGRYRGPLHGIPFGLKDIYDTRGILTTGHSRTRINNIPHRTATSAAKLLQAGAVLLGKLASHEFAHGGPSFDLPWPPARNPWKLDCFTGGSSTGAAAAIAAGFMPAALGSDTGGSVRGPACLSGVVGLKPTYGLVSRYGVMPNSYSLDHCGPMAWTVEDCALLLQAMAGYDAKDPASVKCRLPNYRAALSHDIRGIRVGIVRHFWDEDTTPSEEMRRAIEDAIGILRQLGATVEDTRMRSLQDYRDVKMVIGEAEVFAIYYEDMVNRADEFGVDFLGRTTPACLFQGSDYVRAQRARRRMVADMVPLYERYDVLVTAGLGPAPRLDAYRTIDFWRKSNITNPFNVTGGPALALCIGYAKSGLPLGMQIAGRPFDEQTVLRVGHAYEQATPWRNRRPQLVEGAARVSITSPADTLGERCDDPHVRQRVDAGVRGAGLKLNAFQMEQVYAAAPYALAIIERLRREHGVADEPAHIFVFPPRLGPRRAGLGS